MRILVLTKLLVVFFSLNSCSQSKPINALQTKSQNVINTFFFQIKSNNYELALDSLLKQNEFIDFTDSSTYFLREKFKLINLGSGRYMSSKLLEKRELNNDLAVYAYFVKYERKFYRFMFTFYGNGETIRLYKFSFDDVLDSEMEESIRLSMKSR